MGTKYEVNQNTGDITGTGTLSIPAGHFSTSLTISGVAVPLEASSITLSGTGGLAYTHTQSSPATAWTVTHNLFTLTPQVIVYDAFNEVIQPNTASGVSTSQYQLTFNTAFTGKAVFSTAGASVDQVDFIHADGSVPFNADQSLGGNDLTNVGSITAVTGTFTDGITAGSTFVHPYEIRTGAITATGVVLVPAPTQNFSAATKQYVDNLAVTVANNAKAIVSGSPDLTITSGTNAIVITDNNRAVVSANTALLTVTSGINTITLTPTQDRAIMSDGGFLTVVTGANNVFLYTDAILSGSPDLTITSGTNAVVIRDNNRAIVTPTTGADQLLQVVSGTNTIEVGAKAIVADATGFLSVTSGTNTVLITADAIVAGQGITVVSGASSVTINSTATGNALVGAGNVTVTSGTSTITISGAGTLDRVFTASGTISQYDLVYIVSSGGVNRVASALANSPSTIEVIGMATAGAASGASVNVRTQGVVEGANSGASVGEPLFLSSTSYGDYTNVPPTAEGSFILQVGHAISTTDLYINVNSATAIENALAGIPVLSLNTVTGTVTITGAGSTTVSTLGSVITVSSTGGSGVAHAIVAPTVGLNQGLQVVSGTNVVNLGIKAIVSDSGFLAVTSGTSTISLSADAITGLGIITVVSGTSEVVISGTHPGVAGAIAYNRGGGFATESNFTYNETTNALTVDNIGAPGGITAVTLSGTTLNVAGAANVQSLRASNTVSGTTIQGTTIQALGNITTTASGTNTIGSATNPFGLAFLSPVLPNYETVSGTAQRGLTAIDQDHRVLTYDGTEWGLNNFLRRIVKENAAGGTTTLTAKDSGVMRLVNCTNFNQIYTLPASASLGSNGAVFGFQKTDPTSNQIILQFASGSDSVGGFTKRYLIQDGDHILLGNNGGEYFIISRGESISQWFRPHRTIQASASQSPYVMSNTFNTDRFGILRGVADTGQVEFWLPSPSDFDGIETAETPPYVNTYTVAIQKASGNFPVRIFPATGTSINSSNDSITLNRTWESVILDWDSVEWSIVGYNAGGDIDNTQSAVNPLTGLGIITIVSGTSQTTISGTHPGVAGAIAYNRGGGFATESNFTYSESLNQLSVDNISAAGSISAATTNFGTCSGTNLQASGPITGQSLTVSNAITGTTLVAVTGTFTQGLTVGVGTSYIYPHDVRTGQVQVSGSVGLLPTNSGTVALGTASLPFSTVVANNANFSNSLTVSGVPVRTIQDSVSSYTHTQASPATTWAITHSLGTLTPHVTAYNSFNEVIGFNTASGVSLSTYELKFNQAVSGKAFLTSANAPTFDLGNLGNLTAATGTFTVVTGTTGQFGGTVSAQNVSVSNNLTVSGVPVPLLAHPYKWVSGGSGQVYTASAEVNVTNLNGIPLPLGHFSSTNGRRYRASGQLAFANGTASISPGTLIMYYGPNGGKGENQIIGMAYDTPASTSVVRSIGPWEFTVTSGTATKFGMTFSSSQNGTLANPTWMQVELVG